MFRTCSACFLRTLYDICSISLNIKICFRNFYMTHARARRQRASVINNTTNSLYSEIEFDDQTLQQMLDQTIINVSKSVQNKMIEDTLQLNKEETPVNTPPPKKNAQKNRPRNDKQR